MTNRTIDLQRHHRARRGRGALALATAMLVTLAGAGGALAGRGATVDPGLMTPALSPAFDWECWRAADAITCDGESTDSYTAAEVFPCGDGFIYATGTDHRTVRRISDADGRALTSWMRVAIRDQLSLSPSMEGIVANGRGQFSVAFEWAVPGDQSTRTSILRGADAVAVIPGQGVVLLQVGVISYDIDDNLLFARGVHPIVDDVEAAFGQLCDALSGA
jgi:hypothetical protein